MLITVSIADDDNDDDDDGESSDQDQYADSDDSSTSSEETVKLSKTEYKRLRGLSKQYKAIERFMRKEVRRNTHK